VPRAVTPALTDFSREALDQLRDPSRFAWTTVFILAVVIYVYAVEVERRRWDVVLAGLALWCFDWFNEIVNALVLHVTDRAAIWTVTGDTSYLILVGLCIEIAAMFAIGGVAFAKVLPADRDLRILGMNNRWFLALAFSVFAVFVEVLLHETGFFHWEYWWWNWPFVPLIVVFGYGTFFLVAAKVFDMRTDRERVRFVGAFAAFDVALIVVFGLILGWI
jgi:hypothetical protein